MPFYRYRVVDVFSEEPLAGNPLAVFPDARGLDQRTMQKIAAEFNLSETAFVLPPASEQFAATVRIFTPKKEMLFAGHPTVGASFVLIDEGAVAAACSEFTLDEKIGPVMVRVERNPRLLIWLRTPPIQDGARFEQDRCAQALGLRRAELLDVTPQLLGAGNPTLFIGLASKESIDRASLDLGSARQLRGSAEQPFCVFIFALTADGVYSRMFAPELGVAEDPATGSATGPLAAYLLRNGLISRTEFTSEQGTKMGRRSLLRVRMPGSGACDGIEVGGAVTPLMKGTLTL